MCDEENKRALVDVSGMKKAVVRLAKSLGENAISLSDNLTDKYADNHLKLTSHKAIGEFLIQKAKSLAKIEKKLRQNYIDAPDVERIRIRRDIQEIEKEVRQFKIIGKAKDELESCNETLTDDDKEISPHWMDKFNELAKAHNEDWREELLAKALASEAKKPGSIGPRALWLIGTMEENLFHAFAALIDVCSDIPRRIFLSI